ncbi:MAG: Cyclic pyranopterin monophosphate synthase accessory protein, partial [uncultured Nocardioides sp.]
DALLPHRRRWCGAHGRRLRQGGDRADGVRLRARPGLRRRHRPPAWRRRPQGRHPGSGATGGDHGRQADALPHPAVPPAGPLVGHGRPHGLRRLRRHPRHGRHDRPHRCGDGGADGRGGGRADGHRHGQGGRQDRRDHRRPRRDQDRWPVRQLGARM